MAIPILIFLKSVIIFTMLFERLTGKKSGVSAIVKFPLRMLSIQQLERLSGIVLYSEKTRAKYENDFPGDPFSAGFFVGKSEDFPNYFFPLKRFLKEPRNDRERVSILENFCPLRI